ncbi:hypothetical protein DFH07DRAFT_804057 [Mycena maculata]|uniref:Uncharacterized protein n=1 Tax=Mycena maculata TaxID=230809 RepID=A0AAD7JSW1_9AGAR|nr:hypothetical protein DFH07DRAFT_804057 [Mycena maculata]
MLFKFALFYLWRLFCCCTAVLAVPTWQGLDVRSDFISSLVPHTTYIRVLGPEPVIKGRSHLSSHVPDEPGNLTALHSSRNRSPPLFSLSQDQLWQYKNESTIYPVSVINTTLVEGVPPLQMVLGKQTTNLVTGGTWLWRGTMLRFEYGKSGNNGVFYACPTEGTMGIFMFLTPSATPPGCHIVTLHSFSERVQNAG